MNVRPRLGLRGILDHLGTTLFELVHGDPDLVGDIGGIAIHDPFDQAALPRNALVLGVGLHDGAEMARVLTGLGRQGAAGLVVRSPVPSDTALVTAAGRSGVALVGLARGSSWTQVAALLRTLLESGGGAPDGRTAGSEATRARLGGFPADDLFAMANAVASLVDAPVTIEDRDHRVLAFSGGQADADQRRFETILDRRVPERYARIHAERGVFEELYRSTRPVWIDPVPPGSGQRARVAIAIRAGDEVLGSIWAAVRTPLGEARSRALHDAAELVGLHMFRARTESDTARRLQADVLGDALGGGAGAWEALRRLRLDGLPVVVCALAVAHPAGTAATVEAEARLAVERQKLSDGFAMHLGSVHPRCVSGLLGDVAYGLVPVDRGRGTAGPADEDRAKGEERVLRIADDFLACVGERVPAVIGVGPVALSPAELARSRSCADRVVRVLRSRHGEGSRAARLSDVHGAALVLEMRDLAAGWGELPTGPLARLLAYDERHDSHLVATLRAWLDAFGNVNAAAAGAYVHPSTFRYRLRRVVEVGGLDLDDPETRFTAQLQLRVVDGLAREATAVGSSGPVRLGRR